MAVVACLVLLTSITKGESLRFLRFLARFFRSLSRFLRLIARFLGSIWGNPWWGTTRPVT
jgi:hypothetical protein